MSELTPERIRDAELVLRELNNASHVTSAHTWTVDSLHNVAAAMERDRAAEAKREKRVEELAEELFVLYRSTGTACRDIARALIARYPALVDGPES
ncbi:hypothetical protein ACNQP7_31630 [Mycolicibacterium fortuitum]|uniref:hypothetical protein n=1 Tax=Mycolicibacterium fortuitum TaxID=1766 RepID=UPI003AAD46FC